jgi:hypothetical protein
VLISLISNIAPCPLNDLDERFPESFLLERRVCDVCAGDDQRIESRVSQGVKVAVVPLNVAERIGAAFQFRQGKRVDEKLRNAVTAADEAYELALGGPQRRIRHHVQEADVQLANILVDRTIDRQHLVALIAQVTEGRQARVGDEWHGAEFNVSIGNSDNSCCARTGVLSRARAAERYTGPRAAPVSPR